MKGSIHLLAALVLFGCTQKQDASDTGKPVLFVSIQPQAGLAKTIAGGRVEIHTLVGEGQSPHTYEPTARQLAKLKKANALLTIGMPFEKHLLKKIVPLYPGLTIAKTQQGIEQHLLAHAHCTHEHHEMDPHIWLAPANAITIAQNMAQTLEASDPAHASEYRENFERLADKLRKLDGEIHALLAPHKGARFYVFHPSFGYFAEAYGLEQIPIELDGKTPSPRQLVALVEQAKADGVKVVFVQKQFPADSARAIADAIDGIVVQLDPLAEDVVANLRLIAESIAQALKK